ncbi:hypothetical protein HK104_003991 [Borealophlyctis nickersoniae]|nr:hypothetical protein HK104_003991 [Borealophlyctis nickersoniae]
MPALNDSEDDVAECKSIEKMLESEINYAALSIPSAYQRKHVWTPEMVANLVDDISECMKRDPKDIYYMGNLQRFMTLVIILAVLHQMLDETVSLSLSLDGRKIHSIDEIICPSHLRPQRILFAQDGGDCLGKDATIFEGTILQPDGLESVLNNDGGPFNGTLRNEQDEE